MNCPKCNGKTKVVESLATATSVMRVRKCNECANRFFTEETTEINDVKLRFLFYQARRGEVDV